MRKRKRLPALLLALAMMLPALPVGALAAPTETVMEPAPAEEPSAEAPEMMEEPPETAEEAQLTGTLPAKEQQRFVPEATGFYEFYITSGEDRHRCDELDIYQDGAEEELEYGFHAMLDDWERYSYCTVAYLTAGTGYTIYSGGEYPISVRMAPISDAKTGTRSYPYDTVKGYTLLRFVPTISGWYQFDDQSTHGLYDGFIPIPGEDYHILDDEAYLSYFTAGKTYYFACRCYYSFEWEQNQLPVWIGTPEVPTLEAGVPCPFGEARFELEEAADEGERGGGPWVEKQWFKFTPTVSGTYSFVAAANRYDATQFETPGIHGLAVYQDSVRPLAEKGEIDQWFTSLPYLTFTCDLIRGTTYYICCNACQDGVLTVKLDQQDDTAQQICTTPVSRAANVSKNLFGADFTITYDRKISDERLWQWADVDLTSPGAFAIHRMDNDQVIYQADTSSQLVFMLSYDKRTLKIDPLNYSLDSGTQYYITMGKGFVKFRDGTTNPEIRKGDWVFTTSGTAPLVFKCKQKNVTMLKGAVIRNNFTLSPADTPVYWSSSASDVVSVDDNGVITALREGTAEIYGYISRSEEEYVDIWYTVTVSGEVSVKFNPKTLSVGTNDTVALSCTVRPNGSTVRLTSSDPSVVEVPASASAGQVPLTVKKAGTVTITAEVTAQGVTKRDTCQVTVQASSNENAQLFAAEALKYVNKSKSQFAEAVGKTMDRTIYINDAWCAKFIYLCAEAAGVKSVVPYGQDNAADFIEKLEAMGGTNVTDPQVGDIVNFNEGRHVGIVVDVDRANNKVQVVHGNYHTSYYTGGWVCGPGCTCGVGSVCNGTGATYDIATGLSAWGSEGSHIYGYVRPPWGSAGEVSHGKVTIVLRCPINVRVVYDGEALDSATGQLEASFGSMVVNEAEENITVTLNDNYPVDVDITSTGQGAMDMSVSFEGEDGAVDTRSFSQVPILETTVGKLYPNDSATSTCLEIYDRDPEYFVEAWSADSGETATARDEELTNWYTNGGEIRAECSDDNGAMVELTGAVDELRGAMILAAAYDSNGRLSEPSSGQLLTDGKTVQFTRRMSKGDVLFFLDPDTLAPLCEKVTVQEKWYD